MLTLEELMPVFRKVLPQYCNHRYEFNELLAEVWLAGRVRQLPDIRLAYKAIKADVVDYMRRCEGRGVRRHFLSMDIPGDAGKSLVEKIGVADYCAEDLEWAEELQVLSAGCTPTERFMLRMLADGFSQADVARITGYHGSWISQLLAEYRKTVSTRLGRYYADGDNDDG